MINIDANNHVTGKSIYVDDMAILHGTLYALPFDAPVAHAYLQAVDVTEASKVTGVVAILMASDIPGENQIGGIFPDEPLFVEEEIHFWGQPIGIIVAHSEYACRQARQAITFKYEEKPVITCPKEAHKLGEIIGNPRIFSLGATANIWSSCDYIVEDTARVNGQEHLYIETQGAYARMKEDGSIVVSSSTQGPTAVQKTIARVLNIPMHKVEVDTVRLGGGFGGKEDQATGWAVMCALAAQHLNSPVKMILHRMDDMRMTGKRHPYIADYKIGLTKDLKIQAYQVTFYQNAGAAADLSPAVLERTLFHATNSYFIPNVHATAYSCRTNLPPNTAFRGFGGPQGMFVIESAIAKAAESLGISADLIQYANLLKDGDELSYGQIIAQGEAEKVWNECVKKYDMKQLKASVDDFNSRNVLIKKGLAIQPICFGISFTNTMMNHARALVHIYQDGSIVISTGAVEMGQGVNTKLLQVALEQFGVTPAQIRLESTNTLRIANTSPTAASAGADLNGKALQMACSTLWDRLTKVARDTFNIEQLKVIDLVVYDGVQKTNYVWKDLIEKALQQRVSMSEHAHYSTPKIHFDKNIEKGHPFAYHVYGAAIIEVTLDCMRGTYHFDGVHLVHDLGQSMNTAVDNGQIEGGLVQGIGWMTMEEILYSNKGRLLTNALSTYKIPDIYSVPSEINITHLKTEGHELAIKKSKAVGEPPLMYGLGAYFAIRNAVRAFNPSARLEFDAPYTPEKVLMDLYRDRTLFLDLQSSAPDHASEVL